MNNAKTVTANELATILKSITKSTVCNITYTVDESQSKTVAKIKQLQKQVTITHVYLNHKYANKVNNLNGTTDFVAKSLEDYGKFRISSTLIGAIKSGNVMIDGKVLNSESIKDIKYFHLGNGITKEEAIAKGLFTPAYFKPKTTMGRGTVSAENDFSIINTSLSKIDSITIAKQVYKVV